VSHHLDYPADNYSLDITDAYCFAGPGDDDGPRTVFAINTSPVYGVPWYPGGYYEIRIDTNGDLVEDITFRFTFPTDASGTQVVHGVQLTGRDATDRTATGTVITPPNAPVGQVLNLPGGIKLFAGERRDPFFNYLPFFEAMSAAFHGAAAGKPTFPDLHSLLPATDTFLNTAVRSILVELPVRMTGDGPVNYWATTAYFDSGHQEWIQVQRAGSPVVSGIFDYGTVDFNAATPKDDIDPAFGIWGAISSQVAAVVEVGGTYNQGVHARPTAQAYGAFVADTVLPNVLTFTPGTNARWDPWHGVKNGKGLYEQAADNFNMLALNQGGIISSGLTQSGPILDCFPYLSEAPSQIVSNLP
jgi:hypothetical protein